ncbi:MAG TPA: DUF2997 domain-containing protein [Spirochaetia bacterium]|nr:DUF2997 domain-containing protein [Spirochaetia bacterium]
MNEEKIVVSIGEDGSIEAEAFGFEGPVCMEKLSTLLAELGPFTSERHKDDYFKGKRTTVQRQGEV